MSDQLYQGKVWPRDIEAEIIFLPTEKGGCLSPTYSGYRGQFYYDGMDWDALQFYPDVEQVNSGDTVRVFFQSP